MTISGFKLVTQSAGGIVPPPGAVNIANNEIYNVIVPPGISVSV